MQRANGSRTEVCAPHCERCALLEMEVGAVVVKAIAIVSDYDVMIWRETGVINIKGNPKETPPMRSQLASPDHWSENITCVLPIPNMQTVVQRSKTLEDEKGESGEYCASNDVPKMNQPPMRRIEGGK